MQSNQINTEKILNHLLEQIKKLSLENAILHVKTQELMEQLQIQSNQSL
jgi:hypothetical protein